MTTYALGAVQAHVKNAAHELGARFKPHTIGGFRAGAAYHGMGRALDLMISSRAQGDAIAAYAWQNRARLGVIEVIWRQRIITTKRAGEGWRGMEDRGGVTANHYDHVHLSFADSAGSSDGNAQNAGGLPGPDALYGPLPWLGGQLLDGGGGVVGGLAEVGRFFGALGERGTWVRVLQVVGGAGILVGGVVIVGRSTIAGTAAQAVMTATPVGRVASVATAGANVAAKAASAAK